MTEAYVAEIHFDADAETARWVKGVLATQFEALPHEIHVHPVNLEISWASPRNAEAPTKNHLWYANKCYEELARLLEQAQRQGIDAPEVAAGLALSRLTREALDDPLLTKKRTSQIISALKDARWDLHHTVTGTWLEKPDE